MIYKLSTREIESTSASILPYTYLDFQNETGIARIESSFTNLLIKFDGSSKIGEGYEVFLSVINPSSISLKGILCEFLYDGYGEPARYDDINLTLEPGQSKTITCFISDLTDLELKLIRVTVDFEMISYYK